MKEIFLDYTGVKEGGVVTFLLLFKIHILRVLDKQKG